MDLAKHLGRDGGNKIPNHRQEGQVGISVVQGGSKLLSHSILEVQG